MFETSVALDPGNPLGWYNLANVLWPRALGGPGGRTGDPAAAARALEAVRRAAQLAPLDPRVLVLRGRVEAATGHGAEAREALLRAVELDGAGAAGAEARGLLAELGRGGL